jgi:diguanylate cyclase (GGDEF)-like protein/PAS domain S-box-containing protein
MLTILRRLFARRPPAAPTAQPVDFRLLTEQNNDVIFRCGMDGTAFYVSPSSSRVLGWPPEEMLGKGPADFVLAQDMPAVIAAQQSHDDGSETSATAYRVRRKDGTTVWIEGSARRVVDPATGRHELVIVMRDISERKALEDQLARLAMTDGLTGLANRRAFDTALNSEWLRTQRGQGQLSLLLIDLDHFKAFNDHYGHQVGDDCLRAVASAIRLALRRPADLAARYGGEELAVILPDTDAPGAVKIAQDIQAAIALLAIPHAGNQAGAGIVTMSVGVATALSRAGASLQMPSALLQAADMALYKAKHNGRACVETALLLSGEGGASAAA